MQRHHNRLYPETDNTARPNAKEGQTTNIVKRSSVVALPLWCTVLLRPHRQRGKSKSGRKRGRKCTHLEVPEHDGRALGLQPHHQQKPSCDYDAMQKWNDGVAFLMGHLIDFWKSRLIDFWQSCHLKKPRGHPGEYSDVSSVPRQLCPLSLYSDLSVVQVLHSTVICLGILQYTHINGLDAILSYSYHLAAEEQIQRRATTEE